MTFSSGGFGTPAHLAGELFKLQTGVRATHVPYQGLAQAIPDLMNGTNQFQFITPLPVLQLIAAGKLRALAVTGPARLPALQDVPTVGFAGLRSLSETRASDTCISRAEARVQSVALDAVSMAPESACLESVMPSNPAGRRGSRRRAGRTPFDPE